MFHFKEIMFIFAATVLATLPIRTASQGESFAFIDLLLKKKHTSFASLLEAHLGGFFLLKRYDYVV